MNLPEQGQWVWFVPTNDMGPLLIMRGVVMDYVSTPSAVMVRIKTEDGTPFLAHTCFISIEKSDLLEKLIEECEKGIFDLEKEFGRLKEKQEKLKTFIEHSR